MGRVRDRVRGSARVRVRVTLMSLCATQTKLKQAESFSAAMASKRAKAMDDIRSASTTREATPGLERVVAVRVSRTTNPISSRQS